MSRKDRRSGVIAGLDRVTSGLVFPPDRSGEYDEHRSCGEEDCFDMDDLEIWSLLPEAVSLVDSSLDALSIETPGVLRGGNN